MKSHESVDELLAFNHLDVSPLQQGELKQLKLLIERNKTLPGFIQMGHYLIKGKCLEDILSANNDIMSKYGVCLVARDCRKDDNNIVGFIIIKLTDGVCTISDLGVDSNYAHANRQADDPQCIGQALLLLGCQELFESFPVNDFIGVYASTEEAIDYYKKFHFTVLPDYDGDELILRRQDFQKLNTKVQAGLAKARDPKKSSVGLFGGETKEVKSEGNNDSSHPITKKKK